MGILYHGSTKQGITTLEPHQSTHGEYVYATPYKELALIFAGRCGDDCTYALYRNNKTDPWKIVERVPESLRTMFHNQGSIYTVEDATFKDLHSGFAEFVSSKSVNVIHEEIIPNVIEAIEALAYEGKIELYMYPNKPKEIPQDSSDLIDKQIRHQLRRNKPVTKKSFERIVLLHPYLIEKVNEKMGSLNLKEEPYKKEDLINLFSKAVIKQMYDGEKEQYLNSILISISTIYPEYLPLLKEMMSLLQNLEEARTKSL